MKLGTCTGALRNRFGDEQALKLISEAGFDCVDFSFCDNCDDPDAYINPAESAKNINAWLKKYNLTCGQAHASYAIQYRYGEPDMRFDVSDRDYLDIVNALEAAALIRTEYVVVHSITVPDSEGEKAFEEVNFKFYKSLEPYCEKFNIKIAIENLYRWDDKCNCYRGKLETAEKMREFVKKLNSPWFAVCVDVSHAALAGTQPEHFISRMPKGMVKVVHMHDMDYIKDRHTLPYLGQLDWDAIISSLKSIDYDGNFSYEIGTYLNRFPDEMIPRALKFAHDIGRYLISKFEK